MTRLPRKESLCYHSWESLLHFIILTPELGPALLEPPPMEEEIVLYKAKVTLLYFLNDRLIYCDHVFNSLVLKEYIIIVSDRLLNL